MKLDYHQKFIALLLKCVVVIKRQQLHKKVTEKEN